MGAELHLRENHPVALELKSLRKSVATFQHEAHKASVKLQKYAFNSSYSYERTRELESKNSRLKEEIAVLRANPDISPHPDFLQIQELDLAHQRLIDQLRITEATLELRTNELTNARSELLKARQDAEGEFSLASHIRAREEEGKIRERQLESKARAAEEERRMADLVVYEYADLGRSLEGRRSILPPKVPPKPHEVHENGVQETDQSKNTGATASPALLDSFKEGKQGLKRLLAEVSVESERLEETIAKLERDLAVAETKLEAERKTAELDRMLLAKVQAKLVKLRIDDKAAARIVSRYMEFSQLSTVALTKAMDNLKIRHAATVSNFNLEIDHLQISLATDRRQTKKPKVALDDLSEDIARETYGRRREISLRLALLLREATIAEGLQKWSHNARELFYHSELPGAYSVQGQGDMQASLKTCVEGAEALLQTLNGDISLEMDANGSVARIMAAQNAVTTFVEEFDTPASTTHATPANTDPPRDNTASDMTEPVPLADMPSHSRLTETTSVHASIGSAPLPANQASVSTALPSQPSPATVVNGLPKVVVPAAATHTHTPPPKLSNEHIAINGQKPEPGQGSNSLVILDQVKPATGESKYIEELATNPFVVSADTVHRPARLSSQEANLNHAELQPVIKQGSNPSPASASSIFFPASSQSKYSNIIAHGVALPISLETSTPPPSTPHPLISDLNQVRHRYDSLQRAFRDCHLTLKDLKNSISSVSPVTETLAILQTAIQHHDDFNKDAPVELDITRGYHTLLNVPGAISNETDQVDVENRIRAFVNSTETTVAKTTEQLRRKLDDLQHDVASIKKTLHDLPDLELQQSSTSQTTGWSSWTNILGPPRAASPVPPTFGTIMTSPRLRQSSSFTQSHDNRSSSVESSPTRSNPFAGLGLRIPMPSRPTHYFGVGHSPLASRPGPRPRTISTLGLGSNGTSLTVNSPQSATSMLSRSAISTHWSDQPQEETMANGETETEAEDKLQTDVE
ncbi:hypothetical protein PILCRDRAFT_811059 [Piloderma croceum F 1598]|uniref:Uncharacterized protein n=1 Tax=Piloderma croceum (strain F 1598) TaxID=765440 RepID=A0A0C3GMN6_PILCF|nr:hypothetical protein PILCRDRAFT_811059 [Piloderma croceum F 1598]